MKASVDVAIFGAGPYGLCLASSLAQSGIDFRIFGQPLETWKANMPPGMLLKSYPWASNLYASQAGFTIKEFSSRSALPYHDTMMPLSRETFVTYGEEYRSRLVPNVEPRMLQSLTQSSSGFRAELDDGQVVEARRVVIAVGLQPFKHVPELFNDLPAELCSHSGDYGSLDRLAGKSVTIVGAGASATDLAALLAQAGASVCLVARTDEVKFAGAPRRRGSFARIAWPSSGIGEGWMLKVCAAAPQLVQLLPDDYRLSLAYPSALGPLGGAFVREQVIGRVGVKTGFQVTEAEVSGAGLQLRLHRRDGSSETIKTDHVIAATGYRPDVRRLSFLDKRIRTGLCTAHGAPVLSANYESSISGLHFVGPISATSFGPVMRFVLGTKHPSRSLPYYFSKTLARRSVAGSGFGVLRPAVQQ
jgi:thioredoxin reductase